MAKTKKVVITHLHSRIAKLAEAAIDRGEIVSCDRISNASYLIKRSINGKRPQTTKFTAIGAATLLFAFNTAANGTSFLDPIEPESDFCSPPTPEVHEMGSQPEPESEPESEYLEPEPEPDFDIWDSDLLSEPQAEPETQLLET